MSSLRVSVTCEICGKTFTKCKPAALRSSLCRSCSMKKTYSENPEILQRALEKRRITCTEVYGVDNPAKNTEVKKKEKTTHLKHYGVEHPLQRKEVYEKASSQSHSLKARETRKANALERYGVDHHMKNPEFLKKFEDAAFEKTGYRNPMHNPETIQKVIDKYGRIGSVKGYIYHDIHFDSSWELAFYIWLTDNKKQFIFHPSTPLEYIGDDDKMHLYYPDFLVEGQFYELKGSQFFNESNEPFNMYTQKFWWGKYRALQENKVVILRQENIKEYLEYVKNTYGVGYLKQFKVKEKKASTM